MPRFRIEDFDEQMEGIRARRKLGGQKPASDLLSRVRQAVALRKPQLPKLP